jgi:sugar (pentulose or hexulose) kinase
VVPSVVDAALMGVAVCAAVGAGWYQDVLAASAAMVQVAELIEPDPATAAVYAARFATYRAGYAALKSLPDVGT